MRIVFVCHEYPPLPHGGIGTFVEAMATGLQKRTHEVTVVGFADKNSERFQDGVRVIELRRLNLRFVGNLLSRLRLKCWLRRQIKAQKIDVIEVPEFQGTLPFRIAGCPTVVRLHQSFSAIRQQAGLTPSRGIFLYEKRTLSSSRHWIGVSRNILDITEQTFKVLPKHYAVVYNPVPIAPAEGREEVPPLPAKFVLFAGALARRKGALFLAEAAKGFLSHRPDVHLVYVGGEISTEGDQPASQLICDIVGEQLVSRVHILGHQRRGVVIECMKRAKVFVFPSQLEAFPLVVLEAMSCGLPVVCINRPPFPEIIQDGYNGLLADPLSPKDLSDKVSTILDNPVLASRLANTARDVIEKKFSLDQCIEKTERFYGECIALSNVAVGEGLHTRFVGGRPQKAPREI